MLVPELKHRSLAEKALFFRKQFEREIRKTHDQEVNAG
jgi:hypothetical protein